MAIKVQIIDDHALFRAALSALVATSEIEVVSSVGTVADALAAETEPDVVLLDLALAETNGIASIADLRRRFPRAHVLVLTMHTAPDYAARALASGAAGYALKDQSADEIFEAIRAVTAGQTYLAPKLPRALVEGVRGARERTVATLSPRELEVFHLVTRGLSNDGIAETLGISVKTVETHRAHINAKLGVHSTAELIRYAVRHGLLTPE